MYVCMYACRWSNPARRSFWCDWMVCLSYLVVHDNKTPYTVKNNTSETLMLTFELIVKIILANQYWCYFSSTTSGLFPLGTRCTPFPYIGIWLYYLWYSWLPILPQALRSVSWNGASSGKRLQSTPISNKDVPVSEPPQIRTDMLRFYDTFGWSERIYAGMDINASSHYNSFYWSVVLFFSDMLM